MLKDTGNLVIHFSSPDIGGAERSLLAEMISLQKGSRTIFCILPAEGGLSASCRERSLTCKILPWPLWISFFTQHQLWWKWLFIGFFPISLPSLIRYLRELYNACRQADTVLSSGVKSHCFFLLLVPVLRARIVFNIRDFIEPVLFRRLFALAAYRLGINVIANSRAVGMDYRCMKVRYPKVTLSRPAIRQRKKKSGLVISHIAFFAPYKGQELFLQYARRILDAGVSAHFNLAGDVIYPSPRYRQYKKKVLSLLRELNLQDHVRWLGRINDVQSLLESTHLLLHCTKDPEPFGRIVLEALLCGCEVLCHRGSGVCEITALKQKAPVHLGVEFNKKYVFLELPKKIASRGGFPAQTGIGPVYPVQKLKNETVFKDTP